MDLSQTALVLTKAAAYDRRTIGETDVRAWHEVLDRTDYNVGLAAVAWHYARETRWIMPADILTYARRNVRPVSRPAIESGPPAFGRSEALQANVSRWAGFIRGVLPRSPDKPDPVVESNEAMQKRLDQLRAELDERKEGEA